MTKRCRLGPCVFVVGALLFKPQTCSNGGSRDFLCTQKQFSCQMEHRMDQRGLHMCTIHRQDPKWDNPRMQRYQLRQAGNLLLAKNFPQIWVEELVINTRLTLEVYLLLYIIYPIAGISFSLLNYLLILVICLELIKSL